MPDCRWNRVPGGTCFLAADPRHRRSDLPNTRIDALRASVRATRARHPFHIDACCSLPFHDEKTGGDSSGCAMVVWLALGNDDMSRLESPPSQDAPDWRSEVFAVLVVVVTLLMLPWQHF
jgi:hypothetical protein